jgi:hypothetical protein
MTPIDAVQRHGPAGDDAVASAMWLCQRLGIEPASLGWRGAVNGASARERANGNGSAPPPHDEQPGGHAEENQPIPNVTAMNAASLVENRRPSGSTYV